MRFKKAIKKIAALSAGSFMVGSTILGAMGAADLANYPSPFVKDGRFNGILVVGDKAAAEDVIGVTDIATSLQFAASRPAPAKATGLTEVEGNIIRLSRGGDMLEIGESLGQVRSTITVSEWPALEGGEMITSEGSTSYAQYLKLDIDHNASVVYERDEDENVGAFLKYKQGNPVFEWQMQFEDGLDSTHSGGTLTDLINEKFKMLGKSYEIVKATFTEGKRIDLTLLSGEVSDILLEGETKTYTVGSKTLKITANIFSSSTANEAVFTVEEGGKTYVTDELKEGETDTLDNGVVIGVSDLLTSSKDTVPDQAQFVLGANKLVLSDPNILLSDFSTANHPEVDNENIEDAKVEIAATNVSTTKVQITDIKYRLFADSTKGDTYIAEGHGIREELDEPQGMINDQWDIMFGGLLKVGESEVKLNPQGDKAYKLEFESMEGLKYSIDFVDNSNDASQGWKFGDDDDDLIFKEATIGTNQTQCGSNWTMDKVGYEGNYTVDRFDFNIDTTDRFIVSDIDDSDRMDDTAFTHVLEYDSVDPSTKSIKFTDMAKEGKGKDYTITYDTVSSCSAAALGATCQEGTSINGTTTNLVVGGKSYKVVVGNIAESTTKKPIAVDLDGNGVFDGSCVPVTIKGGGVLNLTRYGGTGNQTAQNITGISSSDNTTTRALLPESSFFFDVLTDKENFDESLLHERIPVNISGPAITPSNNVDLQTGSPVPQGGFSDTNVLKSNYTFTMRALEEDSNTKRGMSAYGVLFEEHDETGGNNADTLTIKYPTSQRGADVYIKAGATTVLGGETGEAVIVSKIEVGATKLASEVKNVAAQNVIAVGGPCANAAAAEVMGNPTDCTSGFEAGKGRVMLYENDGNLAMIVAGYSAADTRRAAQVVANYKDYTEMLKGDSVEVTSTTAGGVEVAAASKPAVAAPVTTTTTTTTATA